MTRFPTLLGLGAAAAVLTLAGCEKPKDRTPPPTAAAAAPALTGAAPAPTAPMPALPVWSSEYVGKTLASVFPGKFNICLGNTDNVQQTYGGASPGVQIVGWGWDAAVKAPIARVLLVDQGGTIAGVGETGMARPDVQKVRPDVTSPTSGWTGYTSQTTGVATAYGLIEDGKSLCMLGSVTY